MGPSRGPVYGSVHCRHARFAHGHSRDWEQSACLGLRGGSGVSQAQIQCPQSLRATSIEYIHHALLHLRGWNDCGHLGRQVLHVIVATGREMQ